MARPGEILFGKYEVQAVVGRGSFGAVYRVIERKTGATLAVKELNASPSEADFAEAAVLRSLVHPHIVTFHGYEEDEHALRGRWCARRRRWPGNASWISTVRVRPFRRGRAGRLR